VVEGVFVVNVERYGSIGLLLALLLSSCFLVCPAAPRVRNRAGLAALTSADLATFALRAAFTSEAAKEILNLLMTGPLPGLCSIWIGYLLARRT